MHRGVLQPLPDDGFSVNIREPMDVSGKLIEQTTYLFFRLRFGRAVHNGTVFLAAIGLSQCAHLFVKVHRGR